MTEFSPFRMRNADMTLKERFMHLSWCYIFLIFLVAATGFVVLYAAANGNWSQWAGKQFSRFWLGCAVALVVAMIDLRFWLKYAYLFYAVAVIMLFVVEFFGHDAMGAQRWLNLGVIRIQPSELMKIALILALARYFHGSSQQEITSISYMIIPSFMVLLPVVLVLKQPDLGTAVLMGAASVSLFFLVGVQMWKFAVLGGIGLISIPIGWRFLHDYQKERVFTFLDPERDPLGKGYHILQSKITLGSGGIFGKGFLQGTQSRLNFLPEKHTDFIFTVLAEEFGLVGSVALLLLYLALIFYGYVIAFRSSSFFGRLLALGLTTNLFLYVFINIAMVMGLLPVVGVPLPMISYGGTVMLTLMFSFGLVECVNVNRDVQIGRRGAYDD
ncbi:MAG: rod shape-determining protein RodA [Alphaproteobacteria bacterium]|nr:rod shape-determining protein RodA [Alphaproteobacteria bacterium]MBO4643993.1 rod shape-determining protein RodA [Alphaproteobacteria bacterium]